MMSHYADVILWDIKFTLEIPMNAQYIKEAHMQHIAL